MSLLTVDSSHFVTDGIVWLGIYCYNPVYHEGELKGKGLNASVRKGCSSKAICTERDPLPPLALPQRKTDDFCCDNLIYMTDLISFPSQGLIGFWTGVLGSSWGHYIEAINDVGYTEYFLPITTIFLFQQPITIQSLKMIHACWKGTGNSLKVINAEMAEYLEQIAVKQTSIDIYHLIDSLVRS